MHNPGYLTTPLFFFSPATFLQQRACYMPRPTLLPIASAASCAVMQCQSTHLRFVVVESRPHSSHYLTEALQILPHILELDSLLLFQKLQESRPVSGRDLAFVDGGSGGYCYCTYCFDAPMKDRFVNEVEFAKFPNEFNVAKHLDLGDGTLLLLLRSKRVVMFVIDWNEHK